MKKRLIFILSFLLALLVSVGAAVWIIVYQTKSPYPTELSGEFSLELSYDKDLLTAQNGQLKGDLIKKGLATNDKGAVTTLVVKHTTLDGTVYSYPIHQAATTTLTNTEFEYGVAEGEGATFKLTETHSKLTTQEDNSTTTEVAVKVLLGGNSNVNSDVQKFLRALLALPTPDEDPEKAKPARFDRGELCFKTVDNYVAAAYVNDTATMQAVAYNGSNNYGNIEGALAAYKNATSSTTVYIIPNSTDTHPFIIKDCEIASKVTLSLPYDRSNIPKQTYGEDAVGYFPSAFNDTTKIKSKVTLTAEATIKNFGAIKVYGKISGGNGGHAGASLTSSDHARIIMDASSQIINGNGSSLDCFGYITEKTVNNKSKITMENGSKLWMMFSIIEHRGGTIFKAIYDDKKNYGGLVPCTPFNRFFLEGITSTLRINYGAKLIGHADLCARLLFSPQHNHTDIDLVGTTDTFFIQLKDTTNSYLEGKYNWQGTDTAKKQSTDLTIHGNTQINSLELSIVSNTISTSGVFFPLSWYFNVTLSGQNTTVSFNNQHLKLFPEATLTIEKGVTVEIGDIIVYNGFADVAVGQPGDSLYEYNLDANGNPIHGNLIVNGTLNANNLAGIVTSTEEGAKVNVKNGCTLSSREIVASTPSYKNHTATLALNDYNDASKTLSDTGAYYSKKRADGTCGWYSAKFKVTYDENGGSAVEDTNVELKQAGGYLFTETILSGKVTTREHYTFTHWCTQDNCTNGSTCANKASGRTVYSDTTLYAAWRMNKYKLNYVYVIPDGDGVKEIDSGITSTEFDITTTTIALNNTPTAPTYTYIDEETGEEITKSYNFSGWFTAAQNGDLINTIVVEDYRDLACANGGTTGEVTIYAVWTKEIVYTVHFNNSHNAADGGYVIIDSTTVKLDDEGNGTLSAPTTANDGKTLLTAHNNNPNDRMYFVGWYVDENFETEYIDFAQLKALVPEDGENYKRTLYAKWITKHTVSFTTSYPSDIKGGVTAPTCNTVYLHESQTFDLTNYNATLDDNNGTTTVNYYFNGWQNVDGATITGGKVSVTKTVTLLPNWERKYTLTVVAQSGATAGTAINLNGTVYLLESQIASTFTSYDTQAKAQNDKTATNKYFVSWNDNITSLSASNFNDNKACTITASWADKYTLIINNPKSGATDGTAIDLGGTIYLLESQITSKFTEYDTAAKAQNDKTATNKYFVNWTLNGTVKDSLTTLTTDDFPNNTCTLTANWEDKLWVKTSISGGTIKINNVTCSNNGVYYYIPKSTLTIEHSFSYSDNRSFSITQEDGSSVSLDSNKQLTISSNLNVNVSSSCITADTLITLADGTQKRVDQLRGDELLLVWNLNTGRYDVAPIVFVDSDTETEYEIVHLYFSDGSDVKVIYEHGFFDLNLRKYVYIDAYNYAEFIGHEFVTQGDISSNTWKKATLTRVVIETERTTAYSPVTFEHLCYYTNGVLSMPGGISGLFNIFEVNTDTMSYDEEQMQKDIETYGLFSYDDFKDLIPEVAFDAFNGKWLKVAIGKGMLTWEDIEYLALRYVPLM